MPNQGGLRPALVWLRMVPFIVVGSTNATETTHKIWLFGGVRIESRGHAVQIPGGSARDLLVFLLLHPETAHRRERLADLLWPDAPPDRIRQQFSDTLYRLRQALGDGWLFSQGQSLQMDPAASLWVDVWAFERLRAASTVEATNRAVELYRGDLAPEVTADWILPRRVLLREGYLNDLMELGRAAENEGRLEQAFEHYHTLSYADPLREEAHRGLMRGYLQQRRYAAALKQYQRLVRLLKDELDLDPLPETQALAAGIRAEFESVAEAAAPEVPFVGRHRERALLIQQLELVQAGNGVLALVEGEAGIGKTRFLEIIAESAAWRGMRVVWGRTDQLEAATPYAPLDQALRSAIPGSKVGLLRKQLTPAASETLGGLVPRLRMGIRMQFAAPPDLPGAIREGLRVLTRDVPLVVILDDIQWAGHAFWDALPFVTALEDVAVLIILSFRSENMRSSESFKAAIQALDRDAAPVHLTLSGLSESDLAGLASALGRPLDGEELRALHNATGGSPLHFQEAVLAASGEGAGSGLARLLQVRMNGLQPDEREALEIAAVLGKEITAGSWQAIGGEPVLEAIPALIQSRLITETPSGYRFQHDLIREQVYGTIHPDRLRALHRLARQELKTAGAPPEVLGWHSEEAEDWADAIRYNRKAGERAAEAYAFDTALEHFRKALSLLTHLDEPLRERIEVLSKKQRLLGITGHLQEWREDVAMLERLAETADHTEALITALEAKLTFLMMDSDLDALQSTAARGVQLARQIYDPAAEARMLSILGQRQYDQLGQREQSLDTLGRAAELAETAGEPHLLVSILCRLAQIQAFAGDLSQAEETSNRALALTQLRPELYPTRPYALQTHALVARAQAEWQIAWSTLHAVIDMVTELNDRWALADAEFAFASISTIIGQYHAAATHWHRLHRRAIDDGMPPDSVLIKRLEALIAYAELSAGKPEPAQAFIKNIDTWIQKLPDSRPKLHALTVAGQIYLESGLPGEAFQILGHALKLWETYANPEEIEVFLWHAKAADECGETNLARASLKRAQAQYEIHRPLSEAIPYHYLHYRILGGLAHLEAAYKAVQRQAAQFEDESLRRAFLENVRINREILSIWAEQVGQASSLVVRLVKADTPLGKRLDEDDYLSVRWTIDAGEADAEILANRGKTSLRRHRLRRLVDEAAAQGAAPTDKDLAAALEVSRRTILRDIQHLTQAGIDIRTRRRS